MNLIIMPVVCSIEMTKRALASLHAQDVGDVVVLVYDNGSRDGVGPWLRMQTSDQLRYIPSLHMQSLNKIWNEALRLTFDSLRLDYVLVVNNDVELRPDTYRLLRDDGGEFVTGVAVGERGQMDNIHPKSRSPHPSYSCFLMRRTVWEKVGPFDEGYWAYCSDAQHHLAMDRAGIDAYALDVPFLHEVSGTLKRVDPELHRELCRRADQDRATFQRKNGFTVGSDEYYLQFRSKRDNKYAVEGIL